ncbi:hypothetical protein [Streptomyces sp. NPDC050422]|uniref:hypothetical protein n=1 Tax=Streptomyces sp. NPDC050422 TaxID=3365614 RepID=UPI0037BAF1B4
MTASREVAAVEWATVSTAADLVRATQAGVPAIEVNGVVRGMPMVTLAPGVRLRGGVLEFGAKGVRLTRDNILENVTVHCPEHEAAILNDTSVADFGTLALRGVRTTGQVLLLARDAVRSGHVAVADVVVEAADVRGRVQRPHGFGVDALQGGFTLWNQQPDPAVEITAELLGVSAGSAERPVRGSGVFVGGHGDWGGTADGGTVRVSTLRTGEIHTDGGIPAGTPDLISGGVFVISGAVVDHVLNAGPVTTYGQNDMVLDNWGRVRTWTATAPVTSHGPSGIGFVNFGALGSLDVQAPITTHGTGARGFNVYDGSLERASFDSIATTGDGSVGIQVSKELPRLEVRGDLTTSGGIGLSLVRGVQVELAAMALSVKPGGRIGTATVGGRIATTGDRLTTVEIDGELGSLTVTGGIHAAGRGADAVRVGVGDVDLTGIDITATDGQSIVHRAAS